jgi:hypothetical protein
MCSRGAQRQDWLTDWPTDRQLQSNSDSDPDFVLVYLIVLRYCISIAECMKRKE